MKKSTANATSSQLKNSLKQLQKLGLYNPKNPRKAPTRYGKALVKQYEGLGLLGNKPKATTIKIPKSEIVKIGNEYRTKRTRKGAVAIVPKKEKVRTYYSKKEHAIITKAGDYKFKRYHDSNVLLRGEWPQLKRGQRLAVPVRSGWRIIQDAAMMAQLMAQYNPGDPDVNFWQYPYILTRA